MTQFWTGMVVGWGLSGIGTFIMIALFTINPREDDDV
jgi:hypothetical protein